MLEAFLFFFIGLAGSAGPGHFGFRILAYRHHLDRHYPFEPGSENGGFRYSWWMMKFGYRKLHDNAMNVFAGSAGVMGWIALVGSIGTAVCIAAKAGT
jgi:hypothetical protein